MAQQNDSNPSSEPEAQPLAEAMTSQPGSDPVAKDAGDTASPYGTRSRNRAGTSRPNYAEDRDIDMDVYDYYQDKKDGDGKRSSRQASAVANGDATRGATNARKTGAGADEGSSKAGPSQIGTKESNSASSATITTATTTTTTTAATTSASATSSNAQNSGSLPPSKKRKAAAQSTGSSGQAAAGGSSRKTQSSAQQLQDQQQQKPQQQREQPQQSQSQQSQQQQQQQQNSSIRWPETNMLTFENSGARPNAEGSLVADDGTVLAPNDHVYLVCEPPGEPYYLGRIMEFLHMRNDSTKPIDALRINWYYRPKDIGRKTSDTRMVFATMHSDTSPLTALRGKCQILHKVEIENMDKYRKMADSFWFEKLYDRYIQKNYDLIPTKSIVNVPDKVKRVLDERWKYVLVEQGRGKELTSAVKLCKRCSGYCGSHDSVDCAVCHYTYHMNCVRPPLLKKPSRGFAWSCAACSRAQERKLEARNTPNVNDPNEAEDDDFLDEEEDDMHGIDTSCNSPADDEPHHQGTAEQIYQASLWPWRYLGMHCKPEDALDYDDRIYPRASTRIGPRNQANVLPWPGRPVEYDKPPEIKKTGKKDSKLSKEAQAALEAEKARRVNRPKWVQDEPPGYTVRGEDFDENDPKCTATPMWLPPAPDVIKPDEINAYMEKAKRMASELGLPDRSTNLQDVAADSLYHADFDTESALTNVRETKKEDFKEPSLTPTEQKKFEEAVLKYGSELHLVWKHVKTMTPGMITRYYYTWKKSERGKQVRSNSSGRKGKKQAKRAEAAASKFADDVAHDDDDSAFDSNKAVEKKRSFMCQFCSTTSSRQWRRAPHAAPTLVNENGVKATSKEKGTQYVVALCRRCAELWRRYAIRFEEMLELEKKVQQLGSKALKRKQDEELLRELQAVQDMGMMTPERAPTPPAPAPATVQEPPRKKLKSAPDKDIDHTNSDAGSTAGSVASKKKEKVAETPPVPELPKPKTLPCAICDQMEPLGEQHVSCRECRLTVHRNCYGIMDNRASGKWVCDMCANDKSPQVSIHYKCVLCPVERTERDFVELPKLTHHKKKMSDKDREREKLEVQQARKAAEFYRKKQEEMNRPINPREPLKRTTDNNWVHVACAVWTPEVKFGNAKALEPSEGIPLIPRARYQETCQACNKAEGACVSCQQCRVPLHVECARQQGYVLGFEMAPVKSSRRDQSHVITMNGESGILSAGVWCKDHVPAKTDVHQMHETVSETGQNALQLYVQNYKQADLTLTGTVRKATLMTTATKLAGTPTQNGLRRSSTTTIPAGGWHQHRNGDTGDAALDAQKPGEKICITCGIDVSPKWWPIDNSQERELTNGHYGALGAEAQKYVEQRKFQCHKCRKMNRTPVPQPPPRPSPPARPSPPVVSAARPPSVPEPSLPAVASLRSPPVALPNHRDTHPSNYAWPAPVHTNGPPPIQAPALVPEHALGPRPPPVTHGFPAPPPHVPRPGFNDWGNRPASQHGSPTRHINGGPPPPPPLHNGPPPQIPPAFTSLRPPPLSGPPPGPVPPIHQNGHAHSPYMNGLPPSPRRLGGPAPPSRYVHPYHQAQPPPPPPPRLPPHGMGNGVPPPPRADSFSQGLHPQRPPPFSNPHIHGSPPVSRNGLPPPPSVLEAPNTIPHPPPPPRQPEHRPASGASANPSLRNLLS